MGLHRLFSLPLVLVGVFFPNIVAAQTQSKPGCPEKCGNLSIPFPFGVGDNCYLNPHFKITCNHSTEPPKPYLLTSNLEVSEILIDGQLTILSSPARDCYNKINGETINFWSWLGLAQFRASKSRNKFTVIGCDSYGYLLGYRDGEPYSAGCMTVCDQSEYIDYTSCSGSGCCKIEIPDGLYEVNVTAHSFNNYRNVSNFSTCTYAFIVEETRFNFSPRYIENMSKDEMFPVALDWSAKKENTSVAEACKANAIGYDVVENVGGFRCKCKPGYEGNPYLGCHDADECKDDATNNCTHQCINTVGSYSCACPKWYKGDGRSDKQGCALQTSLLILIIICVGAAIIVALVGSSWIYLVLKHKRKLKQKERFFRENGGFMLQQKLSRREGSSSFKIFTVLELEKATKNYDKDMIIGKGGFGTVYKGILSDKTEVAIKKCTTTEHIQVEQFVNEVLILSQINHRNVVKLLGCCLEMEAPLLVYEFIPNGTLFEHIHRKEKRTTTFPWEVRIKIAAEVAVALNYLHFEASVPIVHRDVKTTNILLGPNYKGKVSDFGASKFVPLDEIQISTMVQGTLGYLDPEYLLTSQLTDKSDVYSFGVVLVELLTGLKPLSFERPESQRSLAMYFVLSVKHDSLFDIIDPDLINRGKDEELKEVALIANKCLALKGEERPTMKEVAKELEGMLAMEKHPWDQFNSEETEHLLMQHKNSANGDGGSLGSTWFNIEMMSIGGGR